MSPRHSAGWSLGRRQSDRLWPKRILPGRHLNWDAWHELIAS